MRWINLLWVVWLGGAGALPAVPSRSSLLGRKSLVRDWTHRAISSASSSAFDRMDADGSGRLNPSELYATILLLYLKLNKVVKVDEPSRADVQKLFVEFDANRNGHLDKAEFTGLAAVLLGNLGARVFAQVFITLVLCPAGALRIVAAASRRGLFAYACRGARGERAALLGAARAWWPVRWARARACAVPTDMWPLMVCSVMVALLVPPALKLVELGTAMLSGVVAMSHRMTVHAYWRCRDGICELRNTGAQ